MLINSGITERQVKFTFGTDRNFVGAVNMDGDGAVSFVVSQPGVHELDVLATAFHSAPLLASMRMSEPAFLVGSVNASRRVIEDALRAAGVGPGDVCLVTANNFRRPIVRTFVDWALEEGRNVSAV